MDNWVRVILATSFNLLFEYSLRGINDLALHPFLPFFLFMVYFPYFALLEFLIEKYRLIDWHLLLIGIIFGSVAAFFIPGPMFSGMLIFGINWFSFFFITVVWWGTLQGVLTFYFTRMFLPSRKYEVFITRSSVWVLLAILLCMLCVFRVGIKNAPQITPLGAAMILCIAVIATLILYKTKNWQRQGTQTRSILLDVLILLTLFLFIISGIFFRDKGELGIHMVNFTAVKVLVPWSIVIFCITWGYRIITKRAIPV